MSPRIFGFSWHKSNNPWDEAPPWALELRKLQGLILYRLEQIMADLDQVLAEVTDEGTRLDSIQALIDGIRQQLADALAGTTLPPAVQAKVDAVFAGLTDNKAKIDKALNTGTPPATP